MPNTQQEALRKARLTFTSALNHEPDEDDKACEMLFDAAETVLTLLAPFVAAADVNDDEMDALDSALRERP
jgi:hypothetical protein